MMQPAPGSAQPAEKKDLWALEHQYKTATPVSGHFGKKWRKWETPVRSHGNEVFLEKKGKKGGVVSEGN